ncbi:MAG TPA: hypothetical protein PKD19_01090 [Candidatus Saccharibacteria bacterium]|nr:hypothetical protein [Candidatus Saccharibacteria bacterium]HMR38036.1 hypothetical protein [Candidatus Saccharibacteria bacterium]
MDSGYGEVNGVGTSNAYDPSKAMIPRDPEYFLPQMTEAGMDFLRPEDVLREEVPAGIGAAAAEAPSWEH